MRFRSSSSAALGRVKSFARRRPETLIGLLILLVAISGAYVTWQAASVSGAASDFEQRARQDSVLSEYYRGQHAAFVSYEDRLARSFESHVFLADRLDADARRLARTDRDEALRLARSAQEERAVARALRVFFYWDPTTDEERPRPAYNAKANLKAELAGDLRLAELQPAKLLGTADKARDKRLWLVGIDTALIAAIFFLTLAQLAPQLRTRLAGPGVALATTAWIVLLVVQIAIEVPG